MVIIPGKNGKNLGPLYSWVPGCRGWKKFFIDVFFVRRAIGAEFAIRQYIEICKFILKIERQGVFRWNGIRLKNKIIIIRVIDQLLEMSSGSIIHFQVFKNTPNAFNHIDIKLMLFK